MPTRVLIAFDKFKDALTAGEACTIAARELRHCHPDWKVTWAPITDGGDGFCRILTENAGGKIVSAQVSGPRLEPMVAPIGLVERTQLGTTVQALLDEPGTPRDRSRHVAVIEMAAVNGLMQVPPADRDPWQTTSYGTGQLIRAAADLGAGAILLGIGGSATSDLGLGALGALGLEFRAADGTAVCPPFPHTWERIVRVEGALFPSIPALAIACDVANPLLGPHGAAAIYGPQKGLRAEDLRRHEDQAERLAGLLAQHCGVEARRLIETPGAGAAGGVAFGLMTAARARLVPGFDLVSAWLDLEAKIAAADLVITGEGRFDASSLSGKGPGAIAARALVHGKRVVVLAGALGAGIPSSYGARAITPPGLALPEALIQAGANLARAVRELT